ncbi:MAG: 30S ribosomal protein S7 [bacterium]|nr:30S ribosomal protein S7 [bacterium]
MARRKKAVKRDITPDPVFNSVRVEKFINHIMEKGKKSTARTIFYNACEIIKNKSKKDPLDVFEEALKNVAPIMEVKAKRIGGAKYQVPIEVRPERKISLSMRWIIGAARAKKGKPMREKLAQELLEASQNTGTAVKKKETMHRMAEANKAFAHFAR